jgi:hypothetical protein
MFKGLGRMRRQEEGKDQILRGTSDVISIDMDFLGGYLDLLLQSLPRSNPAPKLSPPPRAPRGPSRHTAYDQ